MHSTYWKTIISVLKPNSFNKDCNYYSLSVKEFKKSVHTKNISLHQILVLPSTRVYPNFESFLWVTVILVQSKIFRSRMRQNSTKFGQNWKIELKKSFWQILFTGLNESRLKFYPYYMDESEQIELKGSFILKKPFFYQPSNWMEFF